MLIITNSMKKIIFDKLFTDIIIFFLICSITLTSIVWILQAVNFLDIVSEDGHGLVTYFSFTTLNIPKIFNKLMLLSIFLSIFYIFSNYEEKNQLVIFWINGISKTKFLNKIILFSILFFFISLSVSYYVVPYTQNKARSFIRMSNLDFFPSLIKPRKFIDTVENFTIFLDNKSNQKIDKILIKDSSNTDNSQLIISKSGKIINDENNKFLQLEKGIIINFSNNNLTSFNFEKTNIDLSQYQTKTITAPKIQEIKSLVLFKCISLLLKDKNTNIKISNLSCNNNFYKNLVQELYKRTILPFYIPLIFIIAGFLVLKSKNNPNYKFFKTIVFLSGILFIIFSQISVNLVSKSNFVGLIIILIPLILILSSYIIFLNKTKTSS